MTVRTLTYYTESQAEQSAKDLKTQGFIATYRQIGPNTWQVRYDPEYKTRPNDDIGQRLGEYIVGEEEETEPEYVDQSKRKEWEEKYRAGITKKKYQEWLDEDEVVREKEESENIEELTEKYNKEKEEKDKNKKETRERQADVVKEFSGVVGESAGNMLEKTSSKLNPKAGMKTAIPNVPYSGTTPRIGGAGSIGIAKPAIANVKEPDFGKIELPESKVAPAMNKRHPLTVDISKIGNKENSFAKMPIIRNPNKKGGE